MLAKLTAFNNRLMPGRSLDEQMDNTFILAQQLGFDALVYDYTPVPIDLNGALITPSVLELRNTPADWHALWCSEGFYQIDPVQHLALRSVSPFVWSYEPKAETALQTIIDPCHAPVSSYLHEQQLTCGVSVPIHLPRGGFASLTGLRTGKASTVLKEAQHTLSDFSVIGHALQEAAYPLFNKALRTYPHIHLTKRERECLKWAAEGFTAAEIATQLTRSLAVVTLHLASAMHKLGAKNRVQAVVRATHYRLLDD
ncbi:LuxR family transcriptional regulator [Pseudomonas fluorescens]|uniref:LuxR family transcriptional regulator n=1 Tax=Pseudomonas fluorescens group TaxID=136843 RepID=UPI0015E6F95A|nr:MULTISPECIES: LuxR family transcriptional regulator [Pseudomonas fluorescens group]MBA1431342.1 LuxR family transcriptional regulator [Pseudomonas orientalis]MBD8150248.1 LuxR family transcriptional regulator [Pseudomonas fluorescens]MBD8178538.1 LuxR family transcriptional regulator [Pseudomonas fluorescens]MBD8747813.1 LuxR family transcriptional regulator [Pseudomonas fluorescens]MBD8753360.1 LuxR family transcriptional regulator [Pseudomonas fluorescens]